MIQMIYSNFSGKHFASIKESISNLKKLFLVQLITNVSGRLPENSRNSFVDLQSQKNRQTKDRQKKFVFSLKNDMLYFD